MKVRSSVKRICENCKIEHEITEREVNLLKIDKKKYRTTYTGKGCLSCRNSGYRGRLGIYELLMVNEEISELVLDAQPAYKIKEKAREHGMMTLLEDGLAKVREGTTSLNELIETLGATRAI